MPVPACTPSVSAVITPAAVCVTLPVAASSVTRPPLAVIGCVTDRSALCVFSDTFAAPVKPVLVTVLTDRASASMYFTVPLVEPAIVHVVADVGQRIAARPLQLQPARRHVL